MPLSNAQISFPMFGDNFKICPSEFFTVFGLKIYWYGVIIMVGLVIAVIYLMKRKEEFGLSEDNIYDMLLYVVPLGIIGARLYYVVFNFSLYRDNFWSVFNFRNGGLAIYGGIIFGAIGAIIFCKVKKISIGTILDMCGFGVIIGQIFGRWGNFMNREAYGGETEVFCRMGLSLSDGSWIYVHPTFLYESVWNLIGLILMHYISKKHRKYDGQLFGFYCTWYGFGRFFVEGLRTDSLYLFKTNIRVSQLVGIACFVIGGIYLLVNAKKPHDPLYVELKKMQNEVKIVSETDSNVEEK